MGRKLDFIAQEMNREANTILSKTNDLAISDIGISLKTDIEKVREQIQNIEEGQVVYGKADEYWIWQYGQYR